MAQRIQTLFIDDNDGVAEGHGPLHALRHSLRNRPKWQAQRRTAHGAKGRQSVLAGLHAKNKIVVTARKSPTICLERSRFPFAGNAKDATVRYADFDFPPPGVLR